MTNKPRCMICDTEEDLTVEHIIPQTLWERFGLDPDHDDLTRYRTTLCGAHNQATGALHKRTDMMNLIAEGTPVTRQALVHLADWSVWVTMLLGLASGSGVVPETEARDLLRDRFGGGGGGPPRGIRVYAARVDGYEEDAEESVVPHAVALRGNRQVLLDDDDGPIGFSVSAGPIGAAESIGLGKVALLVLGQTHESGPDHHERLDVTAATVGLERIHPLPK